MKLKLALLVASVALVTACKEEKKEVAPAQPAPQTQPAPVTAPAPTTDNAVAGIYHYGSEVETFTLCSNKETSYWVEGKEELLNTLRDKAIALAKEKQAPYQDVYVKLEYTDLGKAKDGFAADYASVVEAKNATFIEKCE
ncbi:hypothetical protein A4G19_15095 [Pasteurellaceae bacterium Macca]|nr:hypothetical protein [Pasteurellaceae bacterium Macca]